jgi:hypothetical protein
VILQVKDVGRGFQQAALIEQLHVLVAHALDIEGIARHEMAQPFLHLRGADQPAGTAATASPSSRTALLPQIGQTSGKTYSRDVGRPLLQHDADHLGDHVAGALDDDRVADADILAADLVFVVQGRVRHDDAADRDRRQPRDRRQRAGAADLDVDRLQAPCAPARPGIYARSPSAARG